MTTLRVVGMGLGVGLVLLACSGGSSTTGGGSSAANSNLFLQQFCDAYTPCCSKINKTGSSSSCQQIYGALIGNAQYDSIAGSKCIDEIQKNSAAADFCDMKSSETPDCKSVFKQVGGGGTIAPGGTCTNDTDCATQADGAVTCASYYNGATNTDTRICQIQVDGKAGDTPCVGTRDGSSVVFGSSGPPPNPLPTKGFVCDVANNVYCSSKTNACTAIPNVGEPCDTSQFEYACVKTAFCDFGSKKCIDRLPVGSDCAQFSSGCADATYCDISGTKKCTAILADGAPCTKGEQCGQEASCTNGKCQAFGSGSSSLGLAFICGSN